MGLATSDTGAFFSALKRNGLDHTDMQFRLSPPACFSLFGTLKDAKLSLNSQAERVLQCPQLGITPIQWFPAAWT